MGKLMFEISDETVRKAEEELTEVFNRYLERPGGLYIKSSKLPSEYAPIGTSENVCVLPLRTMEGEHPLAVKFRQGSRLTNGLRTYGSEGGALSLNRVDYTRDNVAALVGLPDFPVAIAPHRRLPMHLKCPSDVDISDCLIFENYYPIYGCLVPDLSLKSQRVVMDLQSYFKGGRLPERLRDIREEVVNELSSLVCLFPPSHEADILDRSQLECLRNVADHMVLFPEDDPEEVVAGDLNHFWIPYGGYPGGGAGPLMRLNKEAEDDRTN